MSLWHRILQGVVAFSANTVISNLSAVLSAALVFRYLGVSAYGQLTLILSLYAGATTFLDFGLRDLFTAEIARARGIDNWSWAKYLLTRYLRLNIVTGCMALFISLVMGRQERDPLWFVVGVYLLTTALNAVMGMLFHSYTRYRRLAAQSIVQSLSRLLLLVTLPLWWQGEALLGVAWTYPLMDGMALMVSFWLTRRTWADLRGVSTAMYSLTSLTVLFRQQGVYMALSVPIKRIADQLPVWFLRVLIGDAAVGLFGAAQKGFSLIYGLFSSLETTLFPLVSEQIQVDRERLQIALRQVQKYLFWLGVIAALVGGLVAHGLIVLVAGKAYLAAVPLFRLMLWLLAIYAFLQSQRPLFCALGQQKWLFFSYLLNAVIYVPTLFVAISTLGIMGVVWAWLVYAALSVGTWMIMLRRLGAKEFVVPLSVFTLDSFDRHLWQLFHAQLLRWLGWGGVKTTRE
ncbi:MAG: oligosaccharide flippase family protein [Chloroflexota bacterium]